MVEGPDNPITLRVTVKMGSRGSVKVLTLPVAEIIETGSLYAYPQEAITFNFTPDGRRAVDRPDARNP